MPKISQLDNIKQGDETTFFPVITGAKSKNAKISFNNLILSTRKEINDIVVSAYDIWMEQPENEGKTKEDFLEYLVGPQGEQGLSAYDVWESQSGNSGKTEQQFLDAIKWTDGTIVQVTGTSVNDVMSQNSVTDELDLKLDKSSVVQVTGTSVNDVMSQNSVTDELDLKLDKSSVVQVTGTSVNDVMSQSSATSALGLKLDKSSVVQVTGTSVNDVMSQNSVTSALGSKLDKSSVVQVTGTSVNDVMSQKAVTGGLTGLTSKVDGLELKVKYVLELINREGYDSFAVKIIKDRTYILENTGSSLIISIATRTTSDGTNVDTIVTNLAVGKRVSYIASNSFGFIRVTSSSLFSLNVYEDKSIPLLTSEIGDIGSLNTPTKNSIVASINEVNEIASKSALKSIEIKNIIGLFDDINLTYLTEYLWRIVDSKVVLGTSSYATNAAVEVIQVFENNSVIIVTVIDGAVPVILFADEEDNIIASYQTAPTTPIIVPTGATRLYINRKTSSLFSVDFKYIRLDELEDRVSELEDRSDNIGQLDYSDASYTIEKVWVASGSTVVLGTSSYATNAAVEVIQVFEGDIVSLVSSISGDANKVWFTNSENLIISGIVFNGDTSIVTVPEGSTKLYVNRKTDSSFTCIVILKPFADEIFRIINSKKIKIPIFAPSPQLPADGSATSDFNAETITPSGLDDKFEELIASLSAPQSLVKNNPKVLTKYEITGKDATETYDINAYIISNRNRFAWVATEKLYGWKSSGNVVFYINSCSPRVGDVIYEDSSRTDSGFTITSYNSALQQFTDSASTVYFLSEADDIDAVIIYTLSNPLISGGTSTLAAYSRLGISLGNATVNSLTSITLSSVIYIRTPSQDYHTSQKATIIIWGNEHGPTSDPAEPAIILYRFAKDLTSGCRENQFMQFIKNYCKVIVVPCLNPYGLQNKTRNNGNSININRNYNTVGWATQDDADKGSYAGSENETQYVMNIVKALGADIAIDIHCLGYTSAQANEGVTHYAGYIPDVTLNKNVMESLLGYGFDYTSYGEATPSTSAEGHDWINSIGISGGLLEMNAGDYAVSYSGKQHQPLIMEANYTLMLGAIRLWLYGVDPTLELSNLSIR